MVDPAVTKSGDPSTASIGDTIVFTLVITNNGTVNADNVVVTDAVPSFLDISSVVVAPAGPSVGIVLNTITIDFGTVTPTDVYTVTITTVVNSSATPPGGPNNVTLTTTSPDSDLTNNLDGTPITIVLGSLEIPGTGFAPDQITRLPVQPEEDAYVVYGDLWLEIPSLGLETTIVGVPRSGDGWDVSWLWDQAGYLNGTAFPTWSGNSVITAHVTLPTGQAGPFDGLRSLRFGDRVVIHAWGLRHVYEIQSVELVAPDDLDVFRHEEQSWLTLITCLGYDEAQNTYRSRVAARAVLVSIGEEGSSDSSTSPVSPPSGQRYQLPSWHDDR